jgi:hypothetical protein
MVRKNKFKIPHTKKKDSVQFSITFSIKVKAGIIDDWSNFIHHGEINEDRTPAIWYNNKGAYLHCRVTTSTNINDGIDIKDIQFNKWYHVRELINQDWLYYRQRQNDNNQKWKTL